MFPRFHCRLLSCLLGLLPLASAWADLDFSVEGRPYRLVTTPRTWDAAQADAVALGGSLVHIDSIEENAAILAAIQSTVPATSTAGDGGGVVYAWIGGKEASLEGKYEWADTPGTAFWTGGSAGASVAFSYQNWGRSPSVYGGPEPDNFAGTQNRAAMAMGRWPAAPVTGNIGQAGQWNDINGTNTLAYVVELNGLYVSIRMSHGGVDKGTFCAKLHYDKAPLAVGNFVSLAEGTRAFADASTGRVVKRPYYTGLTWHRIIPNFMCQGGDPLGTGTSGPGYTFIDQFDATLRHTNPGVLSMANSGPDTNGSQFFITVVPTADLDDKHTIFGEVVSGYSTVITPLSTVPTAGSNKPVLPVVMESVQIHRAGTAARNFNAVTQALPVLREVQAVASLDAAKHCLLKWPGAANAEYGLLQTTDLKSWVKWDGLRLAEVSGATPQSFDTNTLYAAPNLPKRNFFRVFEAIYANAFVAPASATGQQVSVNAGGITMNFKFSAARTGTWSIVAPALTGSIIDYYWERTPHGAQFRCLINGLTLNGTPVSLAEVALHYQTITSGGTNIVLTYINPETLARYTLAKLVMGTFTVTPLP